MTNKIHNLKLAKLTAVLMVAVLLAASLAGAQRAFALTFLTKTSVIFTNMNAGAGQTSALIVNFTTSASNTGTALTVSIPAFTNTAGDGEVNGTQAPAQTLGGTNCKTITGASANLPGTPTASGNTSTGLITFSGITAMTASTSYCVVLPSAILTNPTAATTNDTAVVTAGVDQPTTVNLDFITNDQVNVTATVPASFTLGLTANTDAFGTLNSGSVNTSPGYSIDVSTNALHGFGIWASDTNTGLSSTASGGSIPSLTPGTNGTITTAAAKFVLGIGTITQGSGTGTATAAAAWSSSGSGNGSGLNTTMEEIASNTTGTAIGTVIPVEEYATATASTPPASDYSDVVTIVGAGSY